ncbi:MAG: hypothetical protein QM680_10775 [Luteolibacter sp.]
MKYQTILAAALLSLSPAFAGPGHDHSHEEVKTDAKPAGPNGGRIVTAGDLSYEFLVLPDRKVKITFLDKENKPAPLKEQTVTAIGGDRSAPVKLAFIKDGDSLISNQPFPAGDSLPIVIQVKPNPDAKSITSKFSVNLSSCPTCEHAEYACTCGH